MNASTRTPYTKPPRHWKILADHACVTPDILSYDFKGNGTVAQPYIVEWAPHDARNPQQWSKLYKWIVALTVAFATLAVSFCSSAYSGGLRGVMQTFGVSEEVATLGLSLFVLGFALGPLLWAPLSELYGRQRVFFITFAAFTAFNAGASEAQNVQTLLILRFLAGSFGSSPLTNAGGVIADLFDAKERGLAMSLFSLTPFLGPVLGPVVGGFLGETEGWRWIGRLMTIFSGFLWILGTAIVPETYAPVLLRSRASKLSKITGKVYYTKHDIDRGPLTVGEIIQTNLIRPWMLLFREPIVLIFSVYLAIIYGILYMLFGAFPIVYQQERGWSQGIAGLPFLAVAIGMVLAVVYSVLIEQPRYLRAVKAYHGFAPPEARLPATAVGALALPVGLFWHAWTNSPSVPWPASVAAAIPFGFGMVLVFIGVLSYLIDAYTMYAASALAANTVLRSLFGAAFPLFTRQMFDKLGIHWAPSLAGFLALACLPFPLLFYKYGKQIRLKSKYAAEADAFMVGLRARMQTAASQRTETAGASAAPTIDLSDGTSGKVEKDALEEA
ncbi:Major facilitator superfamily [Macrophomina phaseolina MS6]|uniref:Major facilitator superfamily n=1 Tax=Macrophomina phaseolina (strain MS6) TaxID=1126212 RepID=K2RIJ4_MACPH|nr:Major facilitator superfamily [Macrophomina phaseolina MS6]